MEMLDKRLNDKGKNWRHVLKSLKVLDYCLHEGSEMVVTRARKESYVIKTLREFQYIDDDGRDVGQNGIYICPSLVLQTLCHLLAGLTCFKIIVVRVAAKELSALIMDEERLRNERSDRRLWKSRVNGLDDGNPGFGYDEPDPLPRRERPRRPNDDDDVEYRLAIEASKNEAEEEQKRRAKPVRTQEEDEDLARAIKLSKEEEELRRRELEESNAQSLFDDTPVQPAQAQPTGYNQGYQQQPAVDWFGNPINPQQPLTTGYLNNQYAQPTGFTSQPTGFTSQPTGMPNGYANGLSVQPTGFDQSSYGAYPNNYLQPQPTAFSTNNPYGTDPYSQQQVQPPQENFLPAGSNNPWSSKPQSQPEPLKPLPTGSNNPFATRAQTQFFNTQPTTTGPPTLGTLSEERATTHFTPPNPITNFHAPTPPRSTPPQIQHSPHHARLNALLASGEGQDTFGNVGDLRIPAQHTAPGPFVNSTGQGLERLRAAQTGNNPFVAQQRTGQMGFVQPNATGNPWATQRQPPAGSLIDL